MTKEIKIEVKKCQRKDGSSTFNSIKGIGKDGKFYNLKVKRNTAISPDKLPLGRSTIEVNEISLDKSYIYPTYWISISKIVENGDTSKAFEIKEEDLPF